MLIFLDDFSKDAGTWGSDSDADIQRAFKDGQYHITVSKTNTWGASTLGKKLEDFEVEVETTQVSGPDNNDHGLMLRYGDKDNFFRFTIAGTGYYTFDKMKDGQWDTLIDWTETPVIRTGRATNRLRVICQGATFTLFINDVRVGDYTDSDFPSGDVGLEAGTYKDAGAVHISFDSFRLWAVK